MLDSNLTKDWAGKFKDFLDEGMEKEMNQFINGFSVPKEKVTDDAQTYDKVENQESQDQKSRNEIKKKPIPNLKELTFVRLLDPIHIPSYLVEQINDRFYTVDKFYQYQKSACLLQTPTGPNLNEANLLYAITHEKLRQVKGFAWMEIDPLTNNLSVKSFSMDREYWNKADAISLLEEKAKKIMKDLSLSRIVWVTKNPRFCEDKGFKRSKDAIMIFEG